MLQFQINRDRLYQYFSLFVLFNNLNLIFKIKSCNTKNTMHFLGINLYKNEKTLV